MDKRKDHEQEVKALKRKLEEKREELDLSKIEVNSQKEELESCKSKLRKQENMLDQLKDKIECPVRMDIPRSGPVPVCPNGHFVCSNCKAESCPTCRTVMGCGKSLLAVTILENIDHKCKFEDCNESITLEDITEHEEICPHRTVGCPHGKCAEKVPLSKLVDHLLNSNKKCCMEEKAPLDIVRNCSKWKFSPDKMSLKEFWWPMHIYSYSGETFGVYPIKSEGLFYFVVVMFASKTECCNYKFEMIVHEQGSYAQDSEMGVKFHGCPISIDEKKEELNVYGTSERLMSRILKNSLNKSIFSLSCKISKK